MASTKGFFFASFKKHTLWERTTNVPFIWAGPGVPKGIKSDLTVGLVDTYKTLIGLCGLPENPDIDGESLVPVFENPDSAKERMVITTHVDEYSVVNRDWRYISRPVTAGIRMLLQQCRAPLRSNKFLNSSLSMYLIRRFLFLGENRARISTRQ